MKKLLKIFLILVLLGALGVGAIFYLTSGLTEAAANFFDAVKAKNYSVAYAGVSSGFKSATSQAQLEGFLETTGIRDVASTSWNNRSVTIGTGKLEGTAVTNSGVTIPLTINFVKEDGGWKIQSIDKPPSGVSDGHGPSTPTVQEANDLAKNTLKVFADSVLKKDFTPFHEHIALLWQKQVSVQQLNEIFKPFIDQEIDLLPLQQLTPLFDKQPQVEDSILVLTGHFPTKPSSVTFKLKYILEGVTWKTVGTSVDVKPLENSKEDPKPEADTNDTDSEE